MRRRRNRWGTPGPRYLASRCQVRVRFQEVDSLRVVWHVSTPEVSRARS